jgi:REP element-mobilizing transposase RayT
MGGTAKYKIKHYFQGVVCHVYNRGVNKEEIFKDDEDYLFYLKRLRKYKEKSKIDLICYSLIPNHYHYILEQLSGSPIVDFMRSVHTSYGQYFNKKYKRVGPLFQDRFKQIVLEDNEKFIYLSAYINANAKIHRIIEKAEDYNWSSYKDYLGLRNGTLCNKDRILSQFKNVSDYKNFVEENSESMRSKKDMEKILLES